MYLKISQNYHKAITKLSKNYHKAIKKLSQNYHKAITKLSQSYHKAITKLSQSYRSLLRAAHDVRMSTRHTRTRTVFLSRVIFPNSITNEVFLKLQNIKTPFGLFNRS